MLFIRHGKTAYTGQFPDLTDAGKQEIAKVADEIASIIGGRTDVKIISSPLPRALGTAEIIAKRLGHAYEVEQELAIRCMDFYDNEKAAALWAQFPNSLAIDIAYPTDPRFEEGDIVEKRSAIQYRFFKYLGELFERFDSGNLPDVMVHTCHYEVLWDLAAMLGFEKPLSHGEVIRLELSSVRPGVLCIEIHFRGRGMSFPCGTPTSAFRMKFKRG